MSVVRSTGLHSGLLAHSNTCGQSDNHAGSTHNRVARQCEHRSSTPSSAVSHFSLHWAG